MGNCGNCNNATKSTIYRQNNENIVTTSGDYSADATDDVVLVTGVSDEEDLFATVKLPCNPAPGTSLRIVACGAAVQVDPDDATIPGDLNYIAEGSAAEYTFCGGDSCDCDDNGQWIPTCCAEVTPPPVPG